MSKFKIYHPIEGEILKDIQGYEGRYVITDHARVITFNVNKQGHVCYQGWKGGYKKVTLTDANGGRHNCLIHVLVAMAFVPNPDPSHKKEVNHIDTIKTHNWPSNLEWLTHRENMEHASKMGLVPRGETHHFSKLTSELVMTIFNSPLSWRELSLKYGVAKSSVQAIKQGISWSFLTGKVYEKRYDLLSKEQVIEIFYSHGKYEIIALKFGITKDHVGRIKRKKVRESVTKNL